MRARRRRRVRRRRVRRRRVRRRMVRRGKGKRVTRSVQRMKWRFKRITIIKLE